MEEKKNFIDMGQRKKLDKFADLGYSEHTGTQVCNALP
jgi:hypothetical protein